MNMVQNDPTNHNMTNRTQNRSVRCRPNQSIVIDLRIGGNLCEDRQVRLLWKYIMNVRPMVAGSKPTYRVSLKYGACHLTVCQQIYQPQLLRRAFFVHEQSSALGAQVMRSMVRHPKVKYINAAAEAIRRWSDIKLQN